MNHKRPPVPAIVLLVLIIAVSAYFIYTQSVNEKDGALTASGFIEAVQVNLAPEMAGKVIEVLVHEGQVVSQGDPLLKLDPSLLTAQREVATAQVDSAAATLATAQTKYDQTLQAALSVQKDLRALDWRFSAPDEFNQPAWFFEQSEQIAAAQEEVNSSKTALEEANANLSRVISDLNNAEYISTEKRLAEARAAFLVADQVKVQAENAIEGGGLQDAAYDYYNTALDALNAAQTDFNALTNTEAEENVEYARGQVVVAQQRYDAAYARLLSLQTGAESPAVISAAKSLNQAETALTQAKASLALIDTQIDKLTVTAPMDGVVLTRNVEPGEFVQPGSTAFVLGQLTELTITVYIPEDRYGEIHLGQGAEVSVDSFPDQAFTASVIQIADKAEFTPRNVQTVEGRSSTVYAIKLSVTDPQGRLKIGMPADVVFQ
ncbi:MAG: HlyD family efflux transporter periplasmic adaptor subunit [Chloroflexi bacterium]|nr:HlyD family efflux transporter periplasmic adaptor subunit [Chloroflexota bacterium]